MFISLWEKKNMYMYICSVLPRRSVRLIYSYRFWSLCKGGLFLESFCSLPPPGRHQPGCLSLSSQECGSFFERSFSFCFRALFCWLTYKPQSDELKPIPADFWTSNNPVTLSASIKNQRSRLITGRKGLSSKHGDLRTFSDSIQRFCIFTPAAQTSDSDLTSELLFSFLFLSSMYVCVVCMDMV